jgi:hypothetical protein
MQYSEGHAPILRPTPVPPILPPLRPSYTPNQRSAVASAIDNNAGGQTEYGYKPQNYQPPDAQFQYDNPQGNQQTGGQSFLSGIGGLEGVGSIMGGLAGMYSAWKQSELADKTFDFNVSSYKHNSANTAKQYNTSMAQDQQSAGSYHGRSESAIASSIEDNRLEGYA